MPGLRLTIPLLALAALAAPKHAQAQSAEQFYPGRQMVLIVGSAAGSGYDIIGRMVANYMGNYLPGKPNIIVRNMPGAGGVTAANHMNTVVEKDGATISVVGREAVFDTLFSGAQSKANFDAREFLWLGTPNQEVGMAYATTASGIRTIEDAKKREVVVAAAGATSGSAVFPRLVNALLDTKFKIVAGYAGSMDGLLAMERGEADGRVTSGWAGPETNAVMEWVKQGKATLLLQIGINKSPLYPDVPHIMDMAKSEDDRKLMELLFVGQALGRPFFAPSGVPADRGRALQTAFAKTMEDPGFKVEADKQKIDLSPLLGDDMKKIVVQVYDTPKPLLDKAISISAAALK
ncbi:MAG: tripartite tricarboxylate transporter family receptor [Hyphomicrobiales bacterium]|nr:tripartite tricarboxylate transporter family receptor [Hyphomicrobiales bacterium]